MRILVFGINYYPESIGVGKYTTEMCEWLVRRGHTVEIITAMPYYPGWKVLDAYRGRGWYTETIQGVVVHRCPLFVPSHVSGLTRVLHEASFAISSSIYWMGQLFKKHDVVITIAPPLQTGLAGWVYSIFHRTLTIYHIQDLQLDAAKRLQLLKGRWLLWGIGQVEKLILKRSRFVSTISDGMKRVICAKGVPESKMVSLLNWIDTSHFQPRAPDQAVRNRFGIRPAEKVVLYSGNLGEKQGLEVLPNVAEKLRDHGIVFLVVGEGAFKQRLTEEVRSKNLNNVRMFPLQPYAELPDVLAAADLHLVLQKRAASDLVMPSKLTAILAIGGCALVTAEPGSFLHDIVVEKQMAIVVEPENPDALAKAILDNLQQDTSSIRKSAREYAKDQLEKDIILSRFERFLLESCNSKD